MGRLKLRYVLCYTDNRGKERCYFRHRGKRYPLPDPSDEAFSVEYARLLRTVAGQVAPAKDVASLDNPSSLAWLIRSYQTSPEFKKLAPRTQQDYREALSPIALEHGAKPGNSSAPCPDYRCSTGRSATSVAPCL